jgi:hypothetical protein
MCHRAAHADTIGPRSRPLGMVLGATSSQPFNSQKIVSSSFGSRTTNYWPAVQVRRRAETGMAAQTRHRTQMNRLHSVVRRPS